MAIASLSRSVIRDVSGIGCIVTPCCGAGAAGSTSFVDSGSFCAEAAVDCAIETHHGKNSESKTAVGHLTRRCMAIHAPNELPLNTHCFAHRTAPGCPIWDSRRSVWDISQSERPDDKSRKLPRSSYEATTERAHFIQALELHTPEADVYNVRVHSPARPARRFSPSCMGK